MSEEIAVMVTATSPWPDNLGTATKLFIQSPCMVPDVYQLICDRRNIKKVNVAGHEYSSQEIRCTSFTERLGGGGGGGPLASLEDILDPVPGEPLAAREGTIRPAPARTWELDWSTVQAPAQWAPNFTETQGEMLNASAQGTIGIYERYIQNRPPMPTRAQITEDLIWGLQAGAVYFDEISPSDSYF